MMGKAVFSGGCFGVAGADGFLSALLISLDSRDAELSSDCVLITLFLRLDVLKMPPSPPPPPPPSVLLDSFSPPDFLRGSVKALRSLPLGDGLRSGSEMEEMLFVEGSTVLAG